MSKRSRTTPAGTAAPLDGQPVPVVGGREPCPCGSGKRYKACHGRFARIESLRLTERPFAGLVGEGDWVAMREIVPSATATIRLVPGLGSTSGEVEPPPETATVTTVLPMAWPALRRADGSVVVGVQTQSSSGDASRDIASALLAALATAPGHPVPAAAPTGTGPRLQDVVAAGDFTVTVHAGFDHWLDGAGDVTPEVRESLERANGAVVPTVRLSSVESAYWCRIGERRHLRWVMTEPEDTLLDGLARLHATQSSAIVPDSRYVGSFRTHGLVVPVWDLEAAIEADDLETPATVFAERLGDAMSQTAPLDTEERRARAGLVSRQLTLR